MSMSCIYTLVENNISGSIIRVEDMPLNNATFESYCKEGNIYYSSSIPVDPYGYSWLYLQTETNELFMGTNG